MVADYMIYIYEWNSINKTTVAPQCIVGAATWAEKLTNRQIK